MYKTTGISITRLCLQQIHFKFNADCILKYFACDLIALAAQRANKVYIIINSSLK